ncbi:MAG: hypothetical protein AB8B52_04300 [Winogradskyella sp.]|uniref:hypothetical protein n=1 Tax=Winogradskyella sp. TaxID=1883156 RepID=UPI003858E29F
MKKILLCLIAIGLTSCNLEDEIIDQLGFDSEGTLSAKINGQTKDFDSGLDGAGAALISAEVGTETVYGFSVGAIALDDIFDETETTQLGLTLVMEDPNVIVAGANFNYPEDNLLGLYFFEGSNDVYIDADETISATLAISAIDTSNETISGSFSYIVKEPFIEVTYAISNGVFSNVPYNIDL